MDNEKKIDITIPADKEFLDENGKVKSDNILSIIPPSNEKAMEFNIGGIGVNIGKILGEKLVEEYMAKMHPSQIQSIFDYMTKETWKKQSCYNVKEGENPEVKYVLNMKAESSFYNSREIAPTVAEWANVLLMNALKEKIIAKVEEIVASPEYLERANKIAEELVDYATDGYKDDMKARLKARLVEMPLSSTAKEDMYDNSPLREMVENIINYKLRDAEERFNERMNRRGIY